MSLENKSTEELISELSKLQAELTRREFSIDGFVGFDFAYAVLNQMPEGVAIANQNNVFLYTNPAFERIFGYNKNELVGKSAHILNAPVAEDPIKVSMEISRQMEEKGYWDGELQSVKKDGSLIWTHAKLALYTQANNRQLYIGTQEDISDKKQTEARLMEATSHLSSLVNANPDLMFVFDKGGNYVEYYAREEDLYVNSSELLGNNIADVLPEKIANEALGKIDSLLKGDVQLASFDYDLEINGMTSNYSARMVRTEEDKVLAVVSDVTENKELRKQMLQAQKMETVGLLVGGIAHEFNNLLSPIVGHAELILQYLDPESQAKESVEQIIEAGQRAKLLVKKLLAYGRLSQSEKVAVDLSHIVNDVLCFVTKTLPKDINISTDLKSGLTIIAMSEEIQQAVLNLILNAVQSMPNGGAIGITTELEEKSVTLADGTMCAGEFCCFTITDTGCGMDELMLEKIFDPFFTKWDSKDGSGLGLSVVQGIVQQHNGFIEINSEPGKGSCFHICIPKSIEQVKVHEKTLTKPTAGSGRILVIDDEPMMVTLYEKMLSSLSFDVESFSDAHEALAVFVEKPNHFDLVITDYGMPMMSGMDIAKRVQEIKPSIKTLIVSGYSNLLTENASFNRQTTAYLSKPFTLAELSEKIAQLTKLT